MAKKRGAFCLSTVLAGLLFIGVMIFLWSNNLHEPRCDFTHANFTSLRFPTETRPYFQAHVNFLFNCTNTKHRTLQGATDIDFNSFHVNLKYRGLDLDGEELGPSKFYLPKKNETLIIKKGVKTNHTLYDTVQLFKDINSGVLPLTTDIVVRAIHRVRLGKMLVPIYRPHATISNCLLKVLLPQGVHTPTDTIRVNGTERCPIHLNTAKFFASYELPPVGS